METNPYEGLSERIEATVGAGSQRHFCCAPMQQLSHLATVGHWTLAWRSLGFGIAMLTRWKSPLDHSWTRAVVKFS